MNVTLVRSSHPDAPLTEPWPQQRGLCWRVLSGDYLDPMLGEWFDPQRPPRVLLRGKLRRALYLSWRVPLPLGLEWRGYAGCKTYGLDSPAYREWAPANHVYPQDGDRPGSQAMCLSLRPAVFRARPHPVHNNNDQP